MGLSVLLLNQWNRLLSAIERAGEDPSDSDDVRLEKRLAVTIPLIVVPAAMLWGLIYLIFDEPLAASIPFSYAVVASLSIAVLGLTGRYRFFRFSQLLLILAAPFLVMVALGGFVNGSAVVLWALIAPLGALMFEGRRQAIGWLVAYVALIAVSGALEVMERPVTNLPPALVTTFFVMNIAAVSVIAIVMLQYFVGQKNAALHLLADEQEKSERLLLNVLPRDIAAILKNEDRTIADHFDAVSVLFADVVGFTALSVELPPRRMVELLNEVFSFFDTLVDKYDLEKIRTIGDNYMVASGVPRPRSDHAHALAAMALDMNSYVIARPLDGNPPLEFRIGMSSGPAVAGIIGQQKFHYDLWGDMVNTASRMESHGVPGKIQISKASYELLKADFRCEPRGLIDVKGKGEMETWFIEAIRS